MLFFLHLFQQKRVLKHLRSSYSLLWIHSQQLLQKIKSLRVNYLVLFRLEVELTPLVAFIDLLAGSSFEKGSFHEENVEDESSREEVAERFYFLSFLAGNDFWSDISGCSATIEEVVV